MTWAGMAGRFRSPLSPSRSLSLLIIILLFSQLHSLSVLTAYLSACLPISPSIVTNRPSIHTMFADVVEPHPPIHPFLPALLLDSGPRVRAKKARLP